VSLHRNCILDQELALWSPFLILSVIKAQVHPTPTIDAPKGDSFAACWYAAFAMLFAVLTLA